MKIAIDISPLNNKQHAVRGAGFYIQHLRDTLMAVKTKHEFLFLENMHDVPSDIDLIHYPFFEPFFLTLPLKKKYKTVVTVHDLTPLVLSNKFPAGIKGTLKWQVQKIALQQVDKVITDSYASKKDIVEYAAIKDQKVQVVPLAASGEFQQLKPGIWQKEVQKKYSLPDKFLLYVGDATANKNIPSLLKAVKHINETSSSPVHLVIVGKTLNMSTQHVDAYNAWNKDLVSSLLLAENDPHIVRLGFVSTADLVAIYNLATAAITPSLYEGFGLPVVEAMRCACPVITTKEGSLPEVAGEAAYYVNPYDVESIANGIITVFSDGKLQQELSKKGYSPSKKI